MDFVPAGPPADRAEFRGWGGTHQSRARPHHSMMSLALGETDSFRDSLLYVTLEIMHRAVCDFERKFTPDFPLKPMDICILVMQNQYV